MAEIHVPWTKLVAAAKELEFIAVRYGIHTALSCPAGDNTIIAMPVRPDPNQLTLNLPEPQPAQDTSRQ